MGIIIRVGEGLKIRISGGDDVRVGDLFRVGDRVSVEGGGCGSDKGGIGARILVGVLMCCLD